VLKVGQSLLDSYVIIKEDSEGFKMLKEICKENKIIGAEEFTTKIGIEKAYIEANFDRTDMVTIGESIGEKSERDLIPFEGEWFAVVVAESIK